jgi:hypothetical protein
VGIPQFRTALATVGPLTDQDAALRDIFVRRLDVWIGDLATVDKLLDDLNRILGNVWFSDPDVHEAVYQALEAVARDIRSVGGMTTNERLFAFGLLEAWDAGSEATRKRLRLKIGAA